jgi:hypothetical protein
VTFSGAWVVEGWEDGSVGGFGDVLEEFDSKMRSEGSFGEGRVKTIFVC